GPGPAMLLAPSFELFQIVVQVRERVLFDRLPGRAQLLPVGQLGHHGGPLGPDRPGRLAKVAAQLGVGQRRAGRDREWLLAAQVTDSARGVRHAEECAHLVSWVLARISARCTVAVPAFSRDSPPPICIRQEPSPAGHTSAPVASTERILSASMAVDTAPFLTANVPPNPQHTSASGSSTRSMPATLRSSRSGRSPTRSRRSEWQVGW